MAPVTGRNGALLYNGVRVAKCRNFTLDISRDALESTPLGTSDRTYEKGLRGATGSATVLYDPADASTVQLLNSIFNDEADNDKLGLALHTGLNKVLEVAAILTQVGTPVSVGEVTACSINYQVTGPIQGSF